MSDEVKKKAKVLGGVGGGVVSIALLTFLFGYVDREADQVRAESRTYTDLKYDIILEKLTNVERMVREMLEKQKPIN